MKIEKTNRELDVMLGAIRAIAADKLSLPARVGYLLAKNRIALENVLKPYKESYEGIVKKYASDGETSFRINKDEEPEKFSEVTKAIAEIGDEMTSADLTPISIDALDGHDIPFRYIDALTDILKDGEG